MINIFINNKKKKTRKTENRSLTLKLMWCESCANDAVLKEKDVIKISFTTRSRCWTPRCSTAERGATAPSLFVSQKLRRMQVAFTTLCVVYIHNIPFLGLLRCHRKIRQMSDVFLAMWDYSLCNLWKHPQKPEWLAIANITFYQLT